MPAGLVGISLSHHREVTVRMILYRCPFSTGFVLFQQSALVELNP
jgi:hypothetical protein